MGLGDAYYCINGFFLFVLSTLHHEGYHVLEDSLDCLYFIVPFLSSQRYFIKRKDMAYAPA
jgi:hypothetical protein